MRAALRSDEGRLETHHSNTSLDGIRSLEEPPNCLGMSKRSELAVSGERAHTQSIGLLTDSLFINWKISCKDSRNGDSRSAGF